MRKKYLFAVLMTAGFNAQIIKAQDSTLFVRNKAIAVEEMVGDKRQFLQVLVNKPLVERKTVGLLSISSYAADYRHNSNNNEFLNTTLIYHHLFKGISINSGASFTSVDGLKNFIGLQYMYQSKTLSLIYMPSYYFINTHKFSNFALIEFQPVIGENWAIYSRLQLHYNRDLKNGNHFRSYAYGRLGLTYRCFGFGVAHNFDRYTANKNAKYNTGIFLQLSL